MPGPVLHLGAVVTCAHGAPATPIVPQPRVLLSGMPASTLASPFAVAGCSFPPPPVANGPCVTGQFLFGAARVLAMGVPVLTNPGPSVCAPTGTPLLPLVSQLRVIAT